MTLPNFNPTPHLANVTRWLQSLSPQRPLKGLTRFSNLMNRWLPKYKGTVVLQNDIRMSIDSSQSAERWLLYSGNYQPAVTRVLKQHTPLGGYCLDVGANLGFYTLQMARWVGPNGQVTAFEANPAMVERIAYNVSLNQLSRISIVGAAVDRVSGSLDFYVSKAPGKSSIYQIENAINKIVVSAITIDDYIQEQNWPRVDVIKMDIEGNDCQALLGGRNTLAKNRPFIVFEYKNTTEPQIAGDAFKFLKDLNYQLWSLSSTGKMAPFDWQTSQLAHTDIVCLPPAGS